jgi:hypothetical protein
MADHVEFKLFLWTCRKYKGFRRFCEREKIVGKDPQGMTE